MVVCFDAKYLDFVYETVIRDIVGFGNHALCLCVVNKYIKTI